jgi:hypothetical protein
VLVVVISIRAYFGANKKFDCCVVVAATRFASDVFTQLIELRGVGLNGSFGSFSVL